MLERKISASASHAGHHFIGDQEHAMAAADFRDRLHVAWRWRDCSQSRAAHWFKDEGRDFSFCRQNGAFQFGGVLLSAVSAAVGAIELAAITIRNANMRELAHHGKINFAAPEVAGDGARAES